MIKDTNLLVVSAHAADFVWRSGGTIAKYKKHGANVKIVILSYGIRGESADLWRIENQTYEGVKKVRHEEVLAAARELGVENDLEFWDFEDYMMDLSIPERLDRMVRKIREVRPHNIITHGPKDAFNPDHEAVSQFVFKASVMSIHNGIKTEGLPNVKQARLFGFEPHQTEISDFKPDLLIDITEVYDMKEKAMKCFKTQSHLIEYYMARAKIRGNNAARCSGKPYSEYKYAEAFSRFFPYVGGELV